MDAGRTSVLHRFNRSRGFEGFHCSRVSVQDVRIGQIESDGSRWLLARVSFVCVCVACIVVRPLSNSPPPDETPSRKRGGKRGTSRSFPREPSSDGLTSDTPITPRKRLPRYIVGRRFPTPVDESAAARLAHSEHRTTGRRTQCLPPT